MAGNELIAGIAGLAEGIGAFASERRRLRLEKEDRKERKEAAEYAKTQDVIQNKLRQGQLEAENKRIDETAKAAKERLDFAHLKLEWQQRRAAAQDALAKKKVDLQYADRFAALGENVFDLASGVDAYDPSNPATMPGMAPSSPVQPGNAPAGANGQPPPVPNQQASAMSSLGRGVVSPVQNPQLQMGQPAVPYQQGQPVQPGAAPAPQGQLRPGTRTADTRAGAGIVFNQNQGANAAATNAEIKKRTEKIEADIETENNNRRIQNLMLEPRLKLDQLKIREMDDKHRISKQEELLNSAKYDNEVALAHLHTVQAQIDMDLKATNEHVAKQKARLQDLDIEIKKGTLSGFGPASATTGRKEAEEAGKDLDKYAKERVEAEGAAAYLWGLKSRGGVEIPNPDKDKGIQAKNNLIKDTDKLEKEYKATLTRLSEINDRWYQATYHEAEGEYLVAMGTKHTSDGGGPLDKETEAEQENAKTRYEAAKKEYLGLQAQKEKQRKGVAPMPVFPNFTMEPKHFESGNMKHATKKKDAADAFLQKHGY